MTQPIPNRELDRLVDGELSEAERRELLLRLPYEPDGWRRCALAFLEAQSWRQALKLDAPKGMVPHALADEIDTRPGAASVIAMPRRSAWRGRLAIAAAVGFLAFGMGWISARYPEGMPGLARRDEATPPQLLQVVPEQPQVDLASFEPIGMLEIDPENGRGVPARVPVLDASQLPEQWLWTQAPPVSAEVLDQLARRGYRVEQQRRLVSVPLDDGRLVTIPVDEINLVDNGPKTY